MQPARRRRVETGVPAAGDRIYGTGYGIGTLNPSSGESRPTDSSPLGGARSALLGFPVASGGRPYIA